MKRELIFPFVLIAIGAAGLAIYNQMIPSFHWTIALFFFGLAALVLTSEGLTRVGLNLAAALAGVGIAWVSFFEWRSSFILVSSLYFFLLGVFTAIVAVSGLPSSSAAIERARENRLRAAQDGSNAMQKVA
jgi:hypothetical protein